MTKKTIALFLVAVMLLGIFVGCKAVQPQDAAKEPTSSEEAQTSSQGQIASEETQKPVEINWYVVGYPGQKDAEEVQALANEKIQEIYPWITVKFHISTEADFSTHVSLAQATGDPIDVICTYGLDYPTQLGDGAFMDITDYVTEFPDLMSALPEWAYDYGRVDGRLYSFPNWQQCNYSNDSFAIERETADKYGLDINKMNELIQAKETLNDEVYPVIEEFLANARADGREDVVFIPGLMKVNGVLSRGYEEICDPFFVKWSDETCQLVNIWETDAIKDYLVWSQKFKAAGYIPADYFENYEGYIRKTGVDAGYTCFYFDDNSYVPNFRELRLASWGVDLYFMQCQKSETEYYIPAINAAGYTAVGSNSTHPEDALRFIEILYTNSDIYNLLVYGIEGKHYSKNEDGTIKTFEYDNGQANDQSSYGMWKWCMGNSSMAYVNQSGSPEMTAWAFETLPNEATVSNLLGFYVNTEPVSAEMNQIRAVIKEYQQQLKFVGCNDSEATYAEFMEKLDAAGIDHVREVLQSQVDEFLMTKGR